MLAAVELLFVILFAFGVTTQVIVPFIYNEQTFPLFRARKKEQARKVVDVTERTNAAQEQLKLVEMQRKLTELQKIYSQQARRKQ